MPACGLARRGCAASGLPITPFTIANPAAIVQVQFAKVFRFLIETAPR
jgi:hypothetical protein